jgi:hypothetical protein
MESNNRGRVDEHISQPTSSHRRFNVTVALGHTVAFPHHVPPVSPTEISSALHLMLIMIVS